MIPFGGLGEDHEKTNYKLGVYKLGDRQKFERKYQLTETITEI